MKATKQKTEGAVIDLNTRIDRAVTRQLQIEGLQAEQKAERVAIQKLMEGAELERQATPTGNEALRVSKQSYTWDPEKLESLLDDDELETYVPRKPDGTKLRNWLDTLEGDEARNLKKCAKVKNSEVLELRAHGAEAKPGSDD
ncbi:MAG: hypothetical protein HS116_18315 [Planctomycetes bacterium]|nr:hypothetical protein [Planctomycetota bacterium]